MKKNWYSQPSSVPKWKKNKHQINKIHQLSCKKSCELLLLILFFSGFMLELENEQKISFGSKTSPRVSFWIRLFVLPIFETKIVQSVRFWFQKRTRQLLNWKLNKASDFEIKVFQNHRFSKEIRSKNHVSLPFAPWKQQFLQTFHASWKASFWIQNFTTCQILNWQKIQSVKFYSKTLQRFGL